MKHFNEQLEKLLGEAVKEDNHLKYKVDDGLYLKINNEAILGRTIVNIMKKLRLRYLGENREDLSQDILSIAIEKVTEVLFYTYIGHVKLNNIDVNISRVNSKDEKEIRQILNNESDEEKELRVTEFKKLFNSDNRSKYLAIVYNQAINKDFDNNFKTNKLQCETTVKLVSVENNKKKYEYTNLNYISFNTPIEVNGEEVETIEYLYGSCIELQGKCKDNVQNTFNETEGLYKYILERYYDKLTNIQKKFINYAITINEPEIFLKKGNNVYSRQQVRQYREYIQNKVFNLIENDEESILYITENRKIGLKRTNEVQDVIKRILNEKNRINQTDMIVSVLKKDNKCSEIIVNHLLDENMYRPVCDLIVGKISKYKFIVIYLEKVLNALRKIK